ncbi:PIN domain-containing protein [bacterium]|nr:MAG: PIN domain-containing protein [bacterium]
MLNNKQLYISIITELELLAYKGITNEEELIINDFVTQCKTININNHIKNSTIKIRKSYNMKRPDSIIIATALYLNLPLITSDNDFKRVKELTLLLYENN